MGEVLGCDTGFRLRRDPETLRVPDVAFISNERIALIADPKKFSEVSPGGGGLVTFQRPSGYGLQNGAIPGCRSPLGLDSGPWQPNPDLLPAR